MDKYYSRQNYYGYRQNIHKKGYHNYHYKRNQNYYNYNTYNYNKKKRIVYENYEEEISYDKEAALSTKAPSTKDGSFSQSSKSNSRKHSYCDYNNDNTENNRDTQIMILENKKIENSQKDSVPKINLSENDLKTAYYKPKNYKNNSIATETAKESSIKDENENTIILEISVKITKDKIINFKLRKYDDMFKVIHEVCKENKIDEDYTNFFAYTIIKALNSIYGIFNLKLKEKEIEFLLDLKSKIKDE